MPIRRQVKQRKFHDALLNMLYPPPPSPPQQEEDEEVAYILPEGFNVDDQEESGSSSSSHDELELGQQKLTRAQRKRLRKKKIKQTALQRRKMIGPLLPSTSNEGGDILDNEPPSVRRNVAEGLNAANNELGCSHSNKLNHRRKAKRQAKERANSSNIEKISDGDYQPCGQDGNGNTPERIGMDQEKRPA